LPAKDRPGRSGWLGPVALALAIICWIMPVGSTVVAGIAIVCALVSMSTEREYRIDWTAATGVAIGISQLTLSALLMALSASGT